ncbi:MULTISPECIES: phosphonate metabolism protein/1,5-bisphosphokinase (PRPP-forming) PhnN [unclassified Rhizobium]|uniref:phosphonate metabolism protein/1,5-bisphosphokinase (PRPP-forming) PhnN n=1 Tax=unclassified Rhizobium TaxID=2613769 RepID=UPI0006FF4B1E|nr:MULTISPECIES: phosphonate metabolism protein/1,5-bisphosphokinase (PRPP-forming) PhnN [unclassified Rhizobium]KQV35715.1 ribose-phosphate pyrophosphokinase [Rhizobium sp. Root1212]KRD25822.1 ribose-phosphate pyrophosphokinase [Rhizobium sp. Root268]
MAAEVFAGALVVVVGPSGAGKDSVIGFALQALAGRSDIHRVRRVITRAQDAGGEDHEAVSPEEFRERNFAGGFAVSWHAHGLDYGIPVEAVGRLRNGEILIANGSRAALSRFRKVFGRLTVVNITASPEVLASRLAARGRESREEILARLQRRVPDIVDGLDVVTIDNSGPLEEASGRFAELLESIRQPAL